MSEYRAERWFNMRARFSIEFNAENDETAMETAKRTNLDDWIAGDFYTHRDNADVGALCDDPTLNLDRIDEDGREAILEHATLDSCQPYSWDACELVRQIANISAKDIVTSDDVADKFWSIHQKAQEVCGLKDISPAEAFVRRVAYLATEGAYEDSIETLDDIIREATALVGRS